MKIYITKYAEVLYPGNPAPANIVQEITNPHTFTVPENAFGFRFFDIVEVRTDEETQLSIRKIKPSCTFYVGARVLTREQVKDEVPNSQDIVKMMIDSHLEKVIQTRTGNCFLPFHEGAVILSDIKDLQFHKE